MSCKSVSQILSALLKTLIYSMQLCCPYSYIYIASYYYESRLLMAVRLYKLAEGNLSQLIALIEYLTVILEHIKTLTYLSATMCSSLLLTSIQVHIHTHTYVCVVCVHACVRACVCMHMHAHVCISVYVCMVCVYVYACVFLCMHTHAQCVVCVWLLVLTITARPC